MSKADAAAAFELGGVSTPVGTRREIEIPVARLPTGTWVSLPVVVVHGRRPGPRLWLSAAIHGDELNGIEIVRRVLRGLHANSLSGTVVAVPIVNVFGFVQQERCLPDRRDLNRSFPGSPKGSLAARLAHLFMEEVVARCNYGIDLHTGSHQRTNLPQLRADLNDAETERCAAAFGASVMIDARTRDGSLREAATRRGAHVLVYEGGEALRFDGMAIRVGAAGVLRVLAALRMHRDKRLEPAAPSPRARDTRWIRARRGGFLTLDTELGDRVKSGQSLGVISDMLRRAESQVRAAGDGLVIGRTTSPLVYQGDALVHVASIEPAVAGSAQEPSAAE